MNKQKIFEYIQSNENFDIFDVLKLVEKESNMTTNNFTIHIDCTQASFDIEGDFSREIKNFISIKNLKIKAFDFRKSFRRICDNVLEVSDEYEIYSANKAQVKELIRNFKGIKNTSFICFENKEIFNFSDIK